MSAVLTSKLPVNVTNNGFGSSRLFGAGSGSRNTAMSMYHQHQHQQQQQQHQHQQQLGIDPIRAAVTHLLSKAYSLPCSTAAHSFSNLVQPTKRFQLALDALLPILESGDNHNDLAQRILASFILYSLYAPHPIAINPFKSVLVEAFVKERQIALQVQGSEATATNEPFVWVLWKILRGDGNDIGPYSPITLARSPLPPKLRAANLFLEDEEKEQEKEVYDNDKHHNNDIDDPTPTKAAPTVPGPKPATQTPNYDNDEANENLARAMQLILDARGRVLTLSEQRMILPQISALAHSQMITPFDLAPVIGWNSTLAHPLCVALITASSSSTQEGTGTGHLEEEEDGETGMSPFLEVLTTLPPTLATFDLMGRLLRDSTPLPSNPNPNANHEQEGRRQREVRDLIKARVLGPFVSGCIRWLEDAEREERGGSDRGVVGVVNLCRFYHSLIKLSIVSPEDDEEVVEMKQFSLRYSRLQEANGLFRVLAVGGV